MSQSEWKEAARAAERIALETWGRIAPLYETGSHIVQKPEGPATEADRMADRLIGEKLRREFPEGRYGYLTEESEDDLKRLERERVWIIDPIDGTNDFIRKTGNFAMHIGLVEREGAELWRPVAAVVFRPMTGAMYSAVRGGGARVRRYENGQALGGPEPIEASARGAIETMKAVISNSHRTERLDRLIERFGFAEVTSIGSIGIKLSLIATGESDIYLMPDRGKCREWDVCAPELILTEAGGSMTDLDGAPLRYNRKDTRLHEGLLASNGRNHSELVKRFAEFEAEEAARRS